VFIEAKDDGSGGDNWSYKSCKAPVKSSPPTNQHPVFYRPDAFLSPNQQRQSTEGKDGMTLPFPLGSAPSVGEYGGPCKSPCKIWLLVFFMV